MTANCAAVLISARSCIHWPGFELLAARISGQDGCSSQGALDPYAGLMRDEGGRRSIEWGLYGVPETYVIDGDGNVVLRHAGPVTQRVIQETLRAALEGAATN